MTAYQNARAATPPQKGLTYSELLLDNIIGLDNDYLSAGEQLGQAFNADEIGFLKNAGISAYEGAKEVIADPIGAGEELLFGIFDSVENLATEDLDARLKRMYGVGYDQASEDQVTSARESVFGDAVTASGLIPGVGAAGKGISALARSAPGPRPVDLGTPVNNLPEETFDEDGFLTFDDMPVAQPMGMARLPSLLERVQRGDNLTDEEAFDVMTFERYGEEGVYDPTNTLDRWDLGDGDEEGARRIAFLTGARDEEGDDLTGLYVPGANPVARVEGPYFEDQAAFMNVEDPDDFVGTPSYEVRPVVGQAAGLAGLYSPTRKAVDLLDRSSYDNSKSLFDQLEKRGAKPEELKRLAQRLPQGAVSKEDLARLADEASQDVVVSTRTSDNSPQDNPYFLDDTHFLGGAADIGANVFEVPVDAFPNDALRHFIPSSSGRAPILHTRFGMMTTPASWPNLDTYHVGEIQSDWAQTRQKLPTDAKALAKINEDIEKGNEEYDQIKRRYFQREEELGLTESIVDFSDPRFDDPELKALNAEMTAVANRMDPLLNKRDMADEYGTRDVFDAGYPAPYVGTTSKWVQLGLRQSLLDAVNKGAKRMTLSTGEQARKYTGGKLEGQRQFYDVIVPKELDEVLRKFAKEAGIQKPEITMSAIEGVYGNKYTVPTVEFTDDFLEAVKRIGMPSYAKGGIVKGSLLDNDPLDPALY
jgi:hypothetical protein